VIAGSLILTNLSTEHLIGLNADAYRHTIAVMAWETTAALAMVLMALYFLPKYLSRGLTTIPQFLADRYDQTTRVVATVLFLLSYTVAILPIVLLFGASGLENLFDISETWGVTPTQAKWMLVWGVGILGSMYAIFGGLKAVAISDTVNGVGFLIAGLVIPWLALRMIGDGDAWAGLDEVYTENQQKFDITGDEPDSFLPLGVLFTGMIVNQIFFWCTNQSIVQRTLGARSLAEGQKGVLIAAGFKLLGPLIIVLPGVIAFHMFHDELGDDAMQAYPRLVRHVLPPALTGFFAAVMVGAILSTFNSVLNSAATLFSRGIYRHAINKEATDRQTARAGRICSIVLAVVAMSLAPTINSEGSLYEHLQRINATFFGPMLAVILLGMLTRWATASSATIALIAGPIFYYLLISDWSNVGLPGPLGSWLSTISEVHFLHLLAVVFLLTIVGMGILSVLKPSPYQPIDPEKHDFVDMAPWKWRKVVSAVVVIATLVCYSYLAQ
jgi:SSS family solute:Na+ symporter